jgi:hypothetical protein
MTRFAARLTFGSLVLGLALALVGAAQARPASNRSAGIQLSAIANAGLPQSIQANRQAATSGNKIRTTVRQGFVAINTANKALFACTWGSCTNPGKALRKAAQRWLGALRPFKAETKTVAGGLVAARTSLQYWDTTGLDAVNADAAARAKDQTVFDAWYKRYKSNYKLGVKYQNRAVAILSQG